MTQTNKHGLSRDVPRPIAREIRQRCGFGCIRCDCAIYQYHHFDPPFENAKMHNADGITLLCGACHDLEKRKLLAASTIESLNKHPACKQKGFSNVLFDIQGSPEIILGNITFVGTPNMIEAFGNSLLRIDAPEIEKTPVRISALFCDKDGNEIAQIHKNEWSGDSANWDIENKANKITIRNGPRQIALILRVISPTALIIEKLNMFYRGYRFVASEGNPTTIFLPDGNVWFKTNGMRMIGNAHGIVIE